MKLVNFLFILANNVFICRSDSRLVTYTVIGSPPSSESHARVSCAETCADNQYLAARINDATGICEGLTWDWGSDPQYETGFTYIRKTQTVQIYDPALRLEQGFNWLLPGSFGVGAKIEFYITMPTGDWSGFAIELLDTTDISYNVYGGEPEVIMVHMIGNKNSIVFKAWWFGWTNKQSASPIPTLVDGGTYKITFVPLPTVMQILFDDVEVIRYTHPTDPRTAKLFKAGGWGNAILTLHNLTFVGII